MLKWDKRGMDWSTPRWFNIGAPALIVQWRGTRHHVWLWNCFNRRCADGDHYWGVGALRVNTRDLFYIGHEGMCVLFVQVARW